MRIGGKRWKQSVGSSDTHQNWLSLLQINTGDGGSWGSKQRLRCHGQVSIGQRNSWSENLVKQLYGMTWKIHVVGGGSFLRAFRALQSFVYFNPVLWWLLIPSSFKSADCCKVSDRVVVSWARVTGNQLEGNWVFRILSFSLFPL